MESYYHNVQYYETDKMGVTHHSNYIRWMEEARIDFFKKLGFDYLDFEKVGVFSPVIGLNNIRYKKPSTVGDSIEIIVNVKSYNRLILEMHYIMKKENTIIFEGESSHCFIKENGKIIKLGEDNFKSLHEKLLELTSKDE